jgi:hypothetical protein
MKGIQNKIIISEKAFIIHIYGLQPLQKETVEVFSEFITVYVNFSVDSLGGTTNIQMIFKLIPRRLKHIWCYHSHSIPLCGLSGVKGC